MEDAPNLPPNFVGLKPAMTVIGRSTYRVIKAGMDRMVNRQLQAGYSEMLCSYGVEPIGWSVLDETYRTAEVTFLNGVPGLAYPRAHANPKVVFAGACHQVRSDPKFSRNAARIRIEIGEYNPHQIIDAHLTSLKQPR